MILRKHIPNFVSGENPLQWRVTSKDELLEIGWVNQWSKDDFEGVPFYRYSQSKHGDEYLLMGEWKDNAKYKWWVIGYMSDNIGLPEFKST